MIRALLTNGIFGFTLFACGLYMSSLLTADVDVFNKSDAFRNAEARDRVLGLQPLGQSSEDEVRIWRTSGVTFSYWDQTIRQSGYVITPSTIASYSLTSELFGMGEGTDAQVATPVAAEIIMAAKEIAKQHRQSGVSECFDGGTISVDAFLGGERFEFWDSCGDDPGIRKLLDLINKAPAFRRDA